MPAWGLKLASLLATLVAFAGGYGYTSTHVKNPDAPLQPPVADKPTSATPAPTPLPSLVGTRRGQPPRPSQSPGPMLTLTPAVQATVLPQVTFTHVS